MFTYFTYVSLNFENVLFMDRKPRIDWDIKISSDINSATWSGHGRLN